MTEAQSNASKVRRVCDHCAFVLHADSVRTFLTSKVAFQDADLAGTVFGLTRLRCEGDRQAIFSIRPTLFEAYE